MTTILRRHLLLAAAASALPLATRAQAFEQPKFLYGFPAGILRADERIEDAARRELAEETGFDVAEVTRVSPLLYSSSGLTDESVRLVFVTARAVPGSVQQLDDSEEIEVVLLDYAGVCELCRTAEAIDAKTWSVLMMYQAMGRLG